MASRRLSNFQGKAPCARTSSMCFIGWMKKEKRQIDNLPTKNQASNGGLVFCLNLSQIKTSLCFCTQGLLLSQLHTFQEYFAAFCHLFQIYRCHNRDIYERKRKRKIYSGGSIYVYADFHRGAMCHVRRTNTRGTDDLPKLRAGGFGALPSQAKNENYNPILETFLSL